MTDDRPLSADRVPTLTEVVELDLPAARPGPVDEGEHRDTPGEGATAEAAPELTPGEAAARDDAERSKDPVGDAVPQAMAEDFVLAGLDEGEADDAVPAGIGHEAQDPAADMGPPAIEGPLAEDAEAAGKAASVEVPAPVLMFTEDAVGPEVPGDSPAPQAVDHSEPEPGPAPQPPPEPAPAHSSEVLPLPTVDVDAVVGRVLSELTPRIDMLLESRLREALAPALAAAADGLIRDARVNLVVAVRELVQEAVDRALQRRADL